MDSRDITTPTSNQLQPPFVESLSTRLSHLEFTLCTSTTVPITPFTFQPLPQTKQAAEQQRQAQQQHLVATLQTDTATTQTQPPSTKPVAFSVLTKFNELLNYYNAIENDTIRAFLLKLTSLDYIIASKLPLSSSLQQVDTSLKAAAVLANVEITEKACQQLKDIQALSGLLDKSPFSSLATINTRLSALESQQLQQLHSVAAYHVAVEELNTLYHSVCEAISVKFIQLSQMLDRVENVQNQNTNS